MFWKSIEVSASRIMRLKCFEIWTTSEQVERTYDDSRLEGLKVPLLQGVEQSGADMSNNEKGWVFWEFSANFVLERLLCLEA